MTEEEIKKIARDYINRVLPVCAYPSVQIRDDFAAEIHDKAIKFLQWLSKDYAIVPKGVLKSAYNEAQRGFDNASDPLYPTSDYYMGRMSVLKDVFNSLFEEDKK